MSLRLIKIIAQSRQVAGLEKQLNQIKGKGVRIWRLLGSRGAIEISILTHTEYCQSVLELIDHTVKDIENIQIIILSVEASLPVLEPFDEQQAGRSLTKASKAKTRKTKETPLSRNMLKGISYDEIYAQVSKGGELSFNFIMLVILSTIVAAIGVIQNNLAILIGAMLIAPLLGPNLALGLGLAIRDLNLARKAASTFIAGLVICFGFAFAIGLGVDYFYLHGLQPLHVHVGYDNIVLAMVSGAAAVLSLMSGVPGSLVGIMIAVALLPPATIVGLSLALQDFEVLLKSAELLLINIFCIVLTTYVMFVVSGLRSKKIIAPILRSALQNRLVSIIFWIVIIIFYIAVFTTMQFSK